jgi:hypothetical protein
LLVSMTCNHYSFETMRSAALSFKCYTANSLGLGGKEIRYVELEARGRRHGMGVSMAVDGHANALGNLCERQNLELKRSVVTGSER